jgi:DNA-binding MarR family transcriptional regulator
MDRKPAVDAVVKALRQVNVQGSLFGQTVAIRLGLSESDIEALSMLIDSGTATAGWLADRMGLTTGAVTRVVDRLEQSGYVRRVADPADRRRVIVEVVPEKLGDVESLLDRVGRASSPEIARYSDEQLALIGDFLARMAEVTREEADKLRDSRGSDEDPGARGDHAAPLGGLTSARLLVRSGTSAMTLGSEHGTPDLYHARFEGSVPQVRLRDGTVSVQYRGMFDWRRRKALIRLNDAVPWVIDLQGGASNLTADLADLDLRGLSLTGGASQMRVSLGRPTGLVPMKIVGGTTNLAVERPAGVPFRVSVLGGITKLEFDGTKHGSQGGMVSIESPGASRAADRFALEIVGGATKVTVTERR